MNKKTMNYRNNFNRDSYDRIGLMLPKGEKERLQTIAKRCEKSLNALIYECITNTYPKDNS